MIIFEFKNYPSEHNSRLEIRENDQGYDLFLITPDSKEELILSSYRDQWGVFYDFSFNQAICQEDCTLSFLSALTKSLEEFKKLNEFGTLDSVKKEI